MTHNNSVERLIRSDIAGLEEYTPIIPFEVLSERLGFAPQEIVKLDANENPYGPSPKALDAMSRFPYHHIYPDPGQTLLRNALEAYVGVERSHIICGNGSDELLDLLLRLFVEPGDAVINCPPTFGMYSFLSGICGARVLDVPRRADFSLDVEAIEKHFSRNSSHTGPGGIKLIFVCQPNNPDGSVTAEVDLKRLLDLPAVVIVDEAYVEFSGRTVAAWVPDQDNLVVLRTFSKWAGLAGLRIGYGVFPHAVATHAWKIKQPYNINVAAQAAALASLDDLEYLRDNVNHILQERERLYGLLRTIPFLRPHPSQSNFILCDVVDRDALVLKKALEHRGILVRYYDKPGIADSIRISVGKPAQTDALMEVLRNI